MVRVIIFSLFVLIASAVSAQNNDTIQVDSVSIDSVSIISKYYLYVKDINKINGEIYGQLKPDKKGFYGGDGGKFLKKYNDRNKDAISEGLTINRDSINGIFFTFPVPSDSVTADSIVKSIDITLIKAVNKGSTTTPDWWPDSVTYKLRWVFPGQKIEQQDSGEEGIIPVLTEVVGGWRISNIDWILMMLIVIVGIFALTGRKNAKTRNTQPTEEHRKTKAEIEDLQRDVEALSSSVGLSKVKPYISDLQRQIEELRSSNTSSKKKIRELEQICEGLRNSLSELRSNERKSASTIEKKVVTEMESNDRPQQLGCAVPVNGENALVVDNSGSGFFELTRNYDGRITFTLWQNPEVLNIFETNTSMLEIYKKDGIINFDGIPKNSHVRVLHPGVAADAGNGTYKVVNPLVLSFSDR